MKCPRCQQENPPEANFCLKCGSPVDGAATGLRSYAELGREIDRRSQALTEAAEQQTATAEILRIISRSTTDVQPVFEAIADSAMHLFDAHGVAVVRYEGGLLSLAAARGGTPGSASAATERFRTVHRPIAGFPPEQTVLTKKVRQVLLNLLSNAIKFTPEGGRIDVRAVPIDGSVEVSVTDTGIGIAPEDQEAIFEEFK